MVVQINKIDLTLTSNLALTLSPNTNPTPNPKTDPNLKRSCKKNVKTLSVFGVEVGGNADLKQKAGTRHQC